ncbi:GntR family trehalose operon transcriptional repressor [Salisediminibacterium halotolerans]|nr:GntR family trehalose operon transcriptional repressor [Actinophytocola xinjiangensis]RPE87023.1 GntR family trehalose operon transcriptional repressor [Salisediminibacterium halotolerans]TWG32244.1 GntR family trehalose operon transcriptional repressor [Salisediminibacterium halotolerans]
MMMQNKYIQIYKQIAEEISEGHYKPKEKLASEHELMNAYKTSRETIRKALNLLAQNGYIQKIQGKGSIVLDRQKFDFPVSGLVSFKELAGSLGDKHQTHVEELAVIDADDYLMYQLQTPPETKIWKALRVREIDGERIILDKDYFLQSNVPELTKEICEVSIYDYLENDLGLTISFAKKEITVEEPSSEDRRLLHLEGFSNIVVVKNYVYLEDATLLQYTESRHRPDKFKFVDFARRSHK